MYFNEPVSYGPLRVCDAAAATAAATAVQSRHIFHRPKSFLSESRFDDLLGGGEDILRPCSEGLLSPTDIFLASIDGILPAATLSLLIVSSAGAVLN